LLTPIGRLGLPISWVIPLGDCRTRLVQLALLIISVVGISVLVPLMLLTILSIGIPMLLPLTVLAIPTTGIAAGLLPLTVLGVPTIGITTGLLPLTRLTIPAVSIAARLGPVESLMIRLRGKRTIRSGLGAQWAQSHKQTHCQNNAPPFSRAHVIILLMKILHSGFVNLEGRPGKKVNEFF
jgi:hypothetical protein